MKNEMSPDVILIKSSDDEIIEKIVQPKQPKRKRKEKHQTRVDPEDISFEEDLKNKPKHKKKRKKTSKKKPCKMLSAIERFIEKEYNMAKEEAPQNNKIYISGGWTKEEDARLMKIMTIMKGPRLSYVKLAQFFPNRISKQLRDRWENVLNPNINRKPWTYKEDYILLKNVILHGYQWCKISKNLRGRSDNSVKNRFNCHFRNFFNSVINEDVDKKALSKDEIDAYIHNILKLKCTIKTKNKKDKTTRVTEQHIIPSLPKDNTIKMEKLEYVMENGATFNSDNFTVTQFVDITHLEDEDDNTMVNKDNVDTSVCPSNIDADENRMNYVIKEEEMDFVDEEFCDEEQDGDDINEENIENECDTSSYGLKITSVLSLQSFDNDLFTSDIPSTSQQGQSNLEQIVNTNSNTNVYLSNSESGLETALVSKSDAKPITELNHESAVQPFDESNLEQVVNTNSNTNVYSSNSESGLETALVNEKIESVTKPITKLEHESAVEPFDESEYRPINEFVTPVNENVQPISLSFRETHTSQEEFITGIESDIVNNTSKNIRNNNSNDVNSSLTVDNVYGINTLSSDIYLSDSLSLTNESDNSNNFSLNPFELEDAQDYSYTNLKQQNSVQDHTQNFSSLPVFNTSNYALPIQKPLNIIKNVQPRELPFNFKLNSQPIQKPLNIIKNVQPRKLPFNLKLNSQPRIISAPPVKKTPRSILMFKHVIPASVSDKTSNSEALNKSQIPPLVPELRQIRTTIRAPVSKKMVFITKNTTSQPVVVTLQLKNGESIHLKVPPYVMGENVILPVFKTMPRSELAILRKTKKKPNMEYTWNQFQKVDDTSKSQSRNKSNENEFLTIPKITIPSNYCASQTPTHLGTSSSSISELESSSGAASMSNLRAENQYLDWRKDGKLLLRCSVMLDSQEVDRYFESKKKIQINTGLSEDLQNLESKELVEEVDEVSMYCQPSMFCEPILDNEASEDCEPTFNTDS